MNCLLCKKEKNLICLCDNCILCKSEEKLICTCKIQTNPPNSSPHWVKWCQLMKKFINNYKEAKERFENYLFTIISDVSFEGDSNRLNFRDPICYYASLVTNSIIYEEAIRSRYKNEDKYIRYFN